MPGKSFKSMFPKRRGKQFAKCVDPDNMYRFVLVRNKTRYTQKNYVRYPYKVQEACDSKAVSFNFLNDRYKKLHGIGRSMKLSEYEQNDQRKNMTKQLRGKIAKRDNYTCQHCGKYMPDGVGLQIDHIVPISKGGKSIPENLQVLCSKCNGSKSNK